MSAGTEYRVLARKYRPTTFAELVGHETLVRTLANAFDSGRIAHAFMLTGVRGIGKTTTARLIARALNCVGADGTGGPTMDPCGRCEPCRAIAEDRHPDVVEMDAASHTGVDEMRELIDGVRYRPVSARYKVYIIDEVHMLSKAAFNALLKTLEEPPPDIKFVFATTEIHKVPVTVLSRCQRYTLPRLSEAVLASHYRNIAGLEGVEIEPGAVDLIARAADGSVRDGLSILDQAIALGLGGRITVAAVREMLGVADRGLVYDLFETLVAGDAAEALAQLAAFYAGGTDPAMAIQELLDVTHEVTRLKLDRGARGVDETGRGRALAAKLGIAALTRFWQMLLKGLGEVQTAPQPLKAAEMVLVRLAFVSDLPTPGELVKRLQDGAVLTPAPVPTPSPLPSAAPPEGRPTLTPVAQVRSSGNALARTEPQALSRAEPASPLPQSFEAVLDLIAARREAILHALVRRHVHLVRFGPLQIEFRPSADAPRDLATRLGAFLMEATGERWMISVSRAEGQPTAAEAEGAAALRRRAQIEAHPLVRAALEAFPGATIERVMPLNPAPGEAAAVIEASALLRAAPDAPPSGEPGRPQDDPDDPGPFGDGAAYWDPDENDGDET